MNKPLNVTRKLHISLLFTSAMFLATPAQVSAADVEQLYQGACQACHLAGIANAPKLGDKAAWAPRIATGIDALTRSAIKGKNAMPPKGGRMDYSDAQIGEIVKYMVSKSQ